MELKPVRTNDQALGRGATYEPAQEAVDVAQTSKVLRNTYLLLAATMLPTVIGPALGLTISTLVIVVFSLFLLYDLNRIVRGGETNYIMATTGVYMSLFNIFANLLQLLLVLTGEKD